MRTPHDYGVLNTTGDKLSYADQLKVKSAFVHRFTKEHRPAWSRMKRPCGNPYPVQFESDADWLKNTVFAINKTGTLLKSYDCASSPTWPDNPELRKVNA